MKISGVYSITNNVTGDFYIGSSKDIKHRWADHRSPSAQKRQPNSKLYKAMASYGLDNFTFEVLEETADLHNREQYWIEQLEPTYNDRYAKGWHTERYKEAHKRCNKEWYKVNRDYNKERYKVNRNKRLAKNKVDNNRLCLYGSDTLTLRALTSRFCRQGISHAWTEAKNYLIQE